MSTRDRSWRTWRRVGFRVVTGTLGHELLGVRSRRTRLALGWLAGLLALVLASYAGRVVTVGDAPLETHTWGFDALAMVAIALATATVTVAPLAYAVWNGGPALALAMPLVPIAIGDALAGRFALELDAAIAVTVGVASAALALYGAEVRETGSYTPWRTRPPTAFEDRLLFVTAASTVALVTIGPFVATAPSYVRTWYAPFAVLWLVPVVVVSTFWGAWLRRSRETGDDRQAVAR